METSRPHNESLLEKEVEYAKIDYSHLEKKSADIECKQVTAETDHTEVKREGENKTQYSGTEDSGILIREDEELEAMVRQHEKTGHRKTEEEDEVTAEEMITPLSLMTPCIKLTYRNCTWTALTKITNLSILANIPPNMDAGFK